MFGRGLPCSCCRPSLLLAPHRLQEEGKGQMGRGEKRKLSAGFSQKITYGSPNLGEAAQGVGGTEAGDARGDASAGASGPAQQQGKSGCPGAARRDDRCTQVSTGVRTPHPRASISTPCSLQRWGLAPPGPLPTSSTASIQARPPFQSWDARLLLLFPT